MKRIVIILLGILCPILAFAQTGDYNPTNPPNPQWPQPDTTHYYILTLKSDPEGMGSFNYNSGTKFTAGQSVSVYAYDNYSCYFQAWKNAEGTILTTDRTWSFKMPASDLTLYADYIYYPSNPGNPEFSMDYMLTLKCRPEVAGSFNIKSGKVTERTIKNIRAYSNSGFIFKYWEDETGTQIASTSEINFTMPSHATTLYAVYDYSPESPVNPGTNSWDAQSGELIMDYYTPGNLYSAMTRMTSASKIIRLIVDGRITDNDFQFAGYCKNTSYVDLSRVAGVTSIPSSTWKDNTNLREIEIPACISTIKSYAFQNDSMLMAFNCYATVPPALGNKVFDKVPAGMIVYVPEESVPLYQADDDWNMFTISPLRSKICALEIRLPQQCVDGRYKNMTLELVNSKSGQKYRYVITDRLDYKFSSLVRNTTYHAYLKNLSGYILAQTDLITVDNEFVSVTFNEMKMPQTVRYRVNVESGQEVTDQVSAVWTDSKGTFLSSAGSLTQQVAGSVINLDITLPQALGMEYRKPDAVKWTVGENDLIVFNLEKIPVDTIKGRVISRLTRLPVQGVKVTASQNIAGKYAQAISAATNWDGVFAMPIKEAPTSVTLQADDYLNLDFEMTDEMFAGAKNGVILLGEKILAPISGVSVGISFTWQESVLEGETPSVQSFYADYSNVSYSIRNLTSGKDIKTFSAQYPKIIITEGAAAGDEIEISCHSNSGKFNDTAVKGTVTEESTLTLSIPLVGKGGIQARFLVTDNSSVEGVLYDEKGNLVKHGLYKNYYYDMDLLEDGKYTLVTMGESKFFNSIFSLSNMSNAGLVEGVDYVKNELTVKSGTILPVRNVVIPLFDESKFYYTGSNTQFSINKSNVIAGNYLTLTGKVDFQDAYKFNVTDAEIVVSLPESCQMVENSAILGNALTSYEYRDNTVTVPLGEDFTQRVKFCIVPTHRGNFTPNAFVRFKLDGKTIMQPIGSVAYTVTDVTIWSAPLISTPEIFVDGNASAQAQIEVYDGSSLIGTTKALSDGYWSLQTTLKNCTNLSMHELHAKVTSQSGLVQNSEICLVEYNERSIQAKNVEMSFWNGMIGVNRTIWLNWDLEHIRTSSKSYQFTSTEFVFTANLTNNDPKVVHSCTIRVFTSAHDWEELPARYVAGLDRWVATGYFYQARMPIGVRVSVDADLSVDLDFSEYEQAEELISQNVIKQQEIEDQFDDIEDSQDTYVPEETESERDPADCEEDIQDIEEAANEEPVIEIEENTWASNNIPVGQFPYVNNNGNYVAVAVSQDMPWSNVSSQDMETDTIPTNDPDGQNVYVATAADGSIAILGGQNRPNILISMDEDYNENQDPTLIYRASARGQERISTAFVDTLKFELQLLETAASLVNKYIDYAGKPIREQMESIESALEGADAVLASLLAHKQAHPEDLTTDIAIAGVRNNIGKLKKTQALLSKGLAEVNSYIDILRNINWLISYGHYAIQDVNEWQQLHDRFLPCEGLDDPQARGYYIISDSLMQRYGRRYVTTCNIAKAAAYIILNGFNEDTQLDSDVQILDFLRGGVAKYLSEFATSYYRQTKAESRERMNFMKRDKNALKNCNYDYVEVLEDEWDFSLPYPLVTPIIDPQGYVYEGVSSNRIEGVTATAYYKRTYEDMYGDLQQEIVMWDAEQYSQENPLYTDKDGMYQWDVPQGLWQVKFEKEGYRTAYSDWLPVPPPQMDVNIGLVQETQPQVAKARAFETGVELTFSKYMKPATLTSENIWIKGIADTVETVIDSLVMSYPDLEAVTEGDSISYATTVSIATGSLSAYDEIRVIVAHSVESYAGFGMSEDFEQIIDIEKKLTALAADSLVFVGNGQNTTLRIAALPAAAAAGKKVTVRSASTLVATLDNNAESVQLTLDADGQAEFQLNGTLNGTTAILMNVEGENITAQTLVKVVNAAQLEEVKTPVASRISGTQVYSGQTVTLSCETEGASIWYTLDGSCPCESATAVEYSIPIVITDSMTLKIMAIGVNGTESQIREYKYSIRQSSLTLNLEEGWNWTSHDLAGSMQVAMFNGKADTVQTKDGLFAIEEGMTISEALAFNVKMNAKASIGLEGNQFNVSTGTFTLDEGWNWLAYPLDVAMTLEDAFVYLEPSEGDVIVSLEDGYSEFHNGQWTGQLKMLAPGQGYRYMAVTGKSFIYGTVPTVNAQAVYGHEMTEQMPWTVNAHKVGGMYCVTAVLSVEGDRTQTGQWYVGAFNGDECIGLGYAVDSLLFIPVHVATAAGQATDVTFKAVNRTTGAEEPLYEHLNVTADGVQGSMAAPFILNTGDPTMVSRIKSDDSEGDIWNLKGQKLDGVGSERIVIRNGQKQIGK